MKWDEIEDVSPRERVMLYLLASAAALLSTILFVQYGR